MGSLKNNINLHCNGINPSLFIQETNGSESLLYGNILSEILSYASFKTIKQDKNYDFVTKVLQNNSKHTRDAINNYLTNANNEDSYNIFINEVIDNNEQKITTEENKMEINKYKKSNGFREAYETEATDIADSIDIINLNLV